MKNIVLHRPSLANGGAWLDAGTDVEVGDGPEQITLAGAQALIDSDGALSRTAEAALPDTPVDPDPLDHDGDGTKGGSLKGEDSTATKGAAKRRAEV